jgi:hypothetical protein
MAVFRPSTGQCFVRGGATVIFGLDGYIPAHLPSPLQARLFD